MNFGQRRVQSAIHVQDCSLVLDWSSTTLYVVYCSPNKGEYNVVDCTTIVQYCSVVAEEQVVFNTLCLKRKQISKKTYSFYFFYTVGEINFTVLFHLIDETM